MGAGVLQRAELDILHVELALQHVAVGGDRIRVLDHHGQLGERLAHANLLGLTHGKRAGDNLTHLLHRSHQRGVILQHSTQFGGFAGQLILQERPVGQMHGFATGQAAPHGFGFHRSQRGQHAHEGFEHGVQRVERVLIARTETFAVVADVPVGQHVDEVARRIARVGNVEVVQRMLGLLH